MDFKTFTISRDYNAWRTQAREALAAQIPPEQILWQETTDDQLTLFAPTPQSEIANRKSKIPASTPQSKIENPKSKIPPVPAQFADLSHDLFHHRSPERLPLLYRLLWRLTHGERDLLNIEVDDDVRQAVIMRRQVGGDAHRMSGFVRFERAKDQQGDIYLAWYRPDHYVVPMAAPGFVRRFGDMRWSILTPDLCAHWDLSNLTYSPGVPQRPNTSDELVALYQTYYISTNNPQRDNPKLFRQHIPTRFLRDMPENKAAQQIKEHRR